MSLFMSTKKCYYGRLLFSITFLGSPFFDTFQDLEYFGEKNIIKLVTFLQMSTEPGHARQSTEVDMYSSAQSRKISDYDIIAQKSGA